MRIHIITGFYRKHLLPTLIHYLEPMNIEWHPICDAEDIKAFDDNTRAWIHPFLCPPIKHGIDQACVKLNYYLGYDGVNCNFVPFPAGEIIDDDYYCFMGDDDMFEPGFFDVIRQQTAKIIFTALSGGWDTLIPRKLEDIQICHIGLAQYVLKGEILKQMSFRNGDGIDDGVFATVLRDKFPNDIIFLPDLYAFGNFFRQGQFVGEAWKLKSNWESPKII
jgi:hypothetical protein